MSSYPPRLSPILSTFLALQGEKSALEAKLNAAESHLTDLKLELADRGLTIRGSVVDPDLRAVCGVSPAFPADFRTEIPVGGRLTGYRHRYGGKVLEVAVLRQGA